MTEWTTEELAEIEAADQLEIASLRCDGTLRDPVTWVVCLGDDLYVRSVNGRNGAWFRDTQVRHEGRIRAGGVAKDITFIDGDRDIEDEIDNAYRTKYRRNGPSIVGSVVTSEARSATRRLLPRG